MRAVLKLADPAINENAAAVEWLNKVSEVLNQPDMIRQREMAFDDLIRFGMAVSVDGQRVDPFAWFDSTPD